MRGRVRAQCPLPGDSVDAYRVHRQGAVGLDVQAEKMLEVLVVQGCVPLGSVQPRQLVAQRWPAGQLIVVVRSPSAAR
jgi:small ligand-binding sensory domain FIST